MRGSCSLDTSTPSSVKGIRNEKKIGKPKPKARKKEKERRSDSHNTSRDTRNIPRLILVSENRRPSDTPDATTRDEQSATERTFPLSAHVVGLVGERGGDIGVRAGGEEEDAEVTGSVDG